MPTTRLDPTTGKAGDGVFAGPYKYLQRWNFKMNKVILSEPFLDEAEARARYEGRREWFTIVPDVPGIGEGTVVPEFVIEVAVAAPDFKVFFLHPSGRYRRVTFFRSIDGRLFNADVSDYFYEGEPQRGDEIKAIASGVFEPDGTGRAIFRNHVTNEQEVREFRDVPVADRWLDVPAFGEWAPLLADEDAPQA
jgi:hypothetical protein